MAGLLYLVVPAIAGFALAAFCYVVVLCAGYLLGASGTHVRTKDIIVMLAFLVVVVALSLTGKSNTAAELWVSLWFGGFLTLGGAPFWGWVAVVRRESTWK